MDYILQMDQNQWRYPLRGDPRGSVVGDMASDRDSIKEGGHYCEYKFSPRIIRMTKNLGGVIESECTEGLVCVDPKGGDAKCGRKSDQLGCFSGVPGDDLDDGETSEPGVCDVGEMRCIDGETVQVCRGDEQWQTVDICGGAPCEGCVDCGVDYIPHCGDY
jgi:hypothetical protein